MRLFSDDVEVIIIILIRIVFLCRVIIVIDISVSTRPCFEALMKDLKVLFEQQMANKKHYNVIW